MRKTALVLSLLLLLAGVSAAKDDLEFARILAREGFTDTAEEICLRIAASRKTDPAKDKDLAPILAFAKKTSAEQLASVGKHSQALEALEKAADMIKPLFASIPANNDDLSYCDAMSTLGEMERSASEILLTKLVPAATSATDRTSLSERSSQLFESAVEHLSLCAKYASDNPKSSDDTTEWFRLSITSKMSIIEASAFRAESLPGDDPLRKKLANTCIIQANEYIWDYEAYLASYQAMIVDARMRILTGDFLKASSIASSLTALKDDKELDRNQTIKLIILDAFKLKIEAAKIDTDIVRRTAALKSAKSELDLYLKGLEKELGPAFANDEKILDALLETACERISSGDIQAGLTEVFRIISLNRSTKNKALEMAAMALGGNWEKAVLMVNPGFALEIADHLFASGDAASASALISKGVISRQIPEKDRPSILQRAYSLLGRTYESRGMYREAAVCYEAVYDDLAKRYDIDCEKELYSAARCYSMLNSMGENQHDSAKSARLLKRLDDLKGSSSEAGARSIKYLIAIGKMAKKEYLSASEDFDAVEENSKDKDDARVYAGYCLYMHAKGLEAKQASARKDLFMRSSGKLETYLSGQMAFKNDPEQAKRTAQCKYFLSLVLTEDEVGRVAEAVALLREISEYDAGSPEWTPKVLRRLSEACAKAGQYEDAAAVLDGLLIKHPSADELDKTLKLVGGILDTKGSEILKVKVDDARGIATTLAGRNYLWLWCEASRTFGRTPPATDMLILGDKFYLAASYGRDKNERTKFMERAESCYASAIAAKELNKKTALEASIKQAEALTTLDSLEKAVKMLEDLNDKTEGKNGRVILALARATVRWAKQSDKGKADLVKVYGLSVKASNALDKSIPEQLNTWWEASILMAEMRYLSGEYKGAASLLKIITYDGKIPAEFKPAYDDLVARLKTKGVW